MSMQRTIEDGAALVVCLILLSALSAIGISGMSTATVELSLARNLRFEQAAFEAANAGIEQALAASAFSLQSATVAEQSYGKSAAVFSATLTFRGTTEIPRAVADLGTGHEGLVAYHFEVVSTGRAPRNAVVTLRQGFYIIAPAPRA